MSRLSQVIAFINSKKEPRSRDMKTYYTDLELTPELKEARKEYQLSIKSRKK